MSALMSHAEPIIPMSQAALASGLPVTTLRRLVALGKIPSVRVGGVRRVRLSGVLRSIEDATPVQLFEPGVEASPA